MLAGSIDTSTGISKSRSPASAPTPSRTWATHHQPSMHARRARQAARVPPSGTLRGPISHRRADDRGRHLVRDRRQRRDPVRAGRELSLRAGAGRAGDPRSPAIAVAARHGILIKGAAFLENLAEGHERCPGQDRNRDHRRAEPSSPPSPGE